MIIKYLFYLLIFIIYLGQLGRIDLGSGVVVYLSDLLLIFILLVWSIKIIYNKKYRVFKTYLTLPIGLFIFVCLVSWLFNFINLQTFELIYSMFYLLRWIIYGFVFLIVDSLNLNVKKNIIKILILSQLLFIILGLIQYSFYPNLRNLYYLGWDDHLYRLFSTFLDPNFAATQLNLFIFLLVPIILTNNFLSHKYKKLLLVIFSLSFISLLLTYSRSGYLMFTSGIFISLWMLNKKRLILLSFSLLTIGIVLIPKNLGSAGVELWRTASISARSKSLQQAIIIINDNPVFGVGFNSYRYIQKKYGFTDEKNWEVTHSGAGTDNSFLFVFATTGILGIFTYLYLWFVILKRNFNIYKKSRDYLNDKIFSVVIISSVIGLFVNSLFINSLFYPAIMFWMWTILGLGESVRTKE